MILCTGEAVIDMIRTQIEGKGEAYLPIPGGCAYNTSIAISRLGVPAAFFGRISTNFFGEMQINRLRKNNVNTELIIRCNQNPILAFIKTEDGKDPQYAFYEEGTADRLLAPQELPMLSDEINCIVFGSVSIAMEPIGTTIEKFIVKESKNCTTAFDPNIRLALIHDKKTYLRRFEKLAGASAIVKISLEDFGYLQQIAPPQAQQQNAEQPEAALKKLIGLGTQLAIITLGADGAMALLKRDDGSIINASVPGAPVAKIADTVGAGDTFMGAFLARLEMKGKLSNNAIAALSEADLRDALEFANKAAAFVCTQHGCEPPVLHCLKDNDERVEVFC